MPGRIWPLGLCLLIAAGGCLPSESTSLLVSASPFDEAPRPEPTTVHTVQAPASEATAKRVLRVAEQIRTANPQMGIRPVCTTIGAPWEEIFHRNGDEIYLTEGLANQCSTDAQLAAVLCQELGKMRAEREELIDPAARRPDRGPPLEVPVGNDARGAFGPPDGTRAVERAMYDRRRHGEKGAAAFPDPQALALVYLEKAGGTAADLQAVAPLLRAAEEHMTFEKQMNALPTGR